MQRTDPTHLNSFEENETNENLMVSSQGDMVDVASVPNWAPIIFKGLLRHVGFGVIMREQLAFVTGEFSSFFLDFFVQWRYMMTIDIQVNSVISWKQLKVVYIVLTFPYRKHHLLLVNIHSSCLIHDRFWTTLS